MTGYVFFMGSIMLYVLGDNYSKRSDVIMLLEAIHQRCPVKREGSVNQCGGPQTV